MKRNYIWFLSFIILLIVYQACLEKGVFLVDLKTTDNVMKMSSESEAPTFQQLLLKNTNSFTNKEIKQFSKFKEQQYKERREIIRTVCNSLGSRFEMNIRQSSIIFDDVDFASYCPIAKVASSTWSDHFINLSNATEKEKRIWSQAKQDFVQKKWPMPSDLEDVWNTTTSIVIVRHPMSRIASAYSEKLIRQPAKHWGALSQKIIEKYRDGIGSGKLYPNEFISFLLDDLEQGNHHNLDHHWRPQYIVCPFCVLNFTIYSKMEELEQDTFYFITKTNLSKRIQSTEKLNTKHDSTSEASFWRQVDLSLIYQLEQSWAYGFDFQMFGYTVNDYLERIGLDPVL